jgi:hypothetical protein
LSHRPAPLKNTTGVPSESGHAPPWEPSVGLFLGAYAPPRNVACSYSQVSPLNYAPVGNRLITEFNKFLNSRTVAEQVPRHRATVGSYEGVFLVSEVLL